MGVLGAIYSAFEYVAPVAEAIGGFISSGISDVSSAASYVSSSTNSGLIAAIAGFVNETKNVLANVLGPIDRVVNEVSSFARDITDNVIKPLVDPIMKTYNETRDLVEAIHNDLGDGIKGLLKIPEDVSKALTSVDASINRAVTEVGINSKSIATEVITPAMKMAAEVPLAAHAAALVSALRHEDINVGIPQGLPLKLPIMSGETEEAIKLLSDDVYKLGGIFKAIISGLRDLITVSEYLISLNGPLNEVARQTAWGENPTRVLGAGEAIGAHLRGLIDRKQMDDEAGRSGYDESHLNVMLAMSRYLPGIGELLEWFYRGIISEDELFKVSGENSLDAEQIKAVLQASVYLPSAGESLTWFTRGLIDEKELQGLLQQNRLTSKQRDIVQQVFYPPVSAVSNLLLSLRVDSSVKGLLAETFASQVPNGIAEQYKANGLSESQAQTDWGLHYKVPPLAWWIKAFQRGYVTRSEVYVAEDLLATPTELKDSLIDVEWEPIPYFILPAMIAKGAVTAEEGIAQLKYAGYSDSASREIVDYGLAGHKTTKKDTVNALQGVSIGLAGEEYLAGTIGGKEYKNILIAHGYGVEAATLTVSLADQKEQAALRKTMLAEVEYDAIGGLISVSDAVAKLYRLGFSSREVVTSQSKMLREIRSNNKVPGLSELNKMLSAGYITKDDFLIALRIMGYDTFWADKLIKLEEGK